MKRWAFKPLALTYEHLYDQLCEHGINTNPVGSFVNKLTEDHKVLSCQHGRHHTDSRDGNNAKYDNHGIPHGGEVGYNGVGNLDTAACRGAHSP